LLTSDNLGKSINFLRQRHIWRALEEWNTFIYRAERQRGIIRKLSDYCAFQAGLNVLDGNPRRRGTPVHNEPDAIIFVAEQIAQL